MSAANDKSGGLRCPARGLWWLAAYAWLVVVVTSSLVFVGAMVTTRDYGLAVPDWPTSFGTFNPPRWWEIEGVNWEHGHRLLGALVGLLVLVQAVWMAAALRGRRGRWLGMVALAAVIVQGVLGGLRVTEVSTALAVVHGCFAQAFFAFLVFLSAWLGIQAARDATLPAFPSRRMGHRGLSSAAWLFLGACYVQAVLGAVMRHAKAGLAIPDFPLAMGRLVPPLESFPVVIHFAHRAWALVVVAAALLLVGVVQRHARGIGALWFGALAVMALLLVQIGLGASVVLSQRAPVSTCLHVLTGAAILGAGAHLLAHARRARETVAGLSGAPGVDRPVVCASQSPTGVT